MSTPKPITCSGPYLTVAEAGIYIGRGKHFICDAIKEHVFNCATKEISRQKKNEQEKS